MSRFILTIFVLLSLSFPILEAQICDVSTPICSLKSLTEGEAITMPSPDDYPFRDEILNSSIFFQDNIPYPKLHYFFENSGVKWPSPLDGGCGTAFALSNPVIYTITATSTDPVIEFLFSRCERTADGRVGFQVALIKDCIIPELIRCENVERDVSNERLSFQITDAEIGAEYYLVIDGFDGSRCTYEIEEINGFAIDNVTPIEGVEFNGISTLTTPVICSSEQSPILLIKSQNSDALVDSRWRILDESNNVVYNPNKSGHFLKLPESILEVPGKYTFDVELVSPCTEVKEDLFFGSFEIVDDLADTNHQLDFCGPGPFDTLGVMVTEAGTMTSTVNSGSICESVITIESKILHIENGRLTLNECNQVEFEGDITDESEVLVDYIWSENGTVIDNSGADPKILNIDSDGTYSLVIEITGFSSSCSFDIGEIVAQYNPPSFPIACMAVDAESIKINWDPVPRATSYALIVNGDTQTFASTELSTVLTGLSRNTDVAIVVEAYLPGDCKAVAQTNCTTLTCDSSRAIAIENIVSDSVLCESNVHEQIPLRYQLTGDIEMPTVQWFINNQAVMGDEFDPSGLDLGEYTIRAELLDNGCSAISEESRIEILGVDDSFDFTIQPSGCVNEDVPILFSGTTYDLSQYNITAEGAAEVIVRDDGTPALRWPSIGTHKVSISLDAADCINTRTINKEITIEDVNGLNDLRITSNSKSAIIEWDPIDCVEEYEVFINGISVETTSGQSYTYLFAQDEQQVDVRVGIKSGSCLCPLDSPIAIAVKDSCPKIKIEIVSPPSICLDGVEKVDPIILDAQIDGIEQMGDLSWSGLCLIQGTQFSPSCAGIGSHIITATYVENGCTFTESIEINVDELPAPTFEIIDERCPGENPSLYIADDDQSMVFLNDDIILESETKLSSGRYSLEFVNDSGCRFTEDFVIGQIVDVDLAIQGPQHLKQGASANYTLSINESGRDVSQVMWSYADESICSSNCLFDFELENVQASGQLCVELLLEGECPKMQCIDIEVEPQLLVYMPNSLINITTKDTPENQIFKLQTNSDNSFVENIRIINRKGDLVYSEMGLTSGSEYLGWDGRDKQQNLAPPGVYLFVAEIRDELGNLVKQIGDVTFFH